MKKLLFVMFFLLLCIGTVQSAIVLDFEGLQDQEQILEFYNGGTGGSGSSSGVDYDMSFGSNALAIIDVDAGGSGNFGGEPSPDTVMYFLDGSAVLNTPKGFETGFSFSYSAIDYPGSIKVYDGLNATGNLLSDITLPNFPSDGGDPNGYFSPFKEIGVSISGTAKSIDFGGTVNKIGFDNITFGSMTPGVEYDLPFQVGDESTNPELSSRITIYDNKGDTKSFESNLPTYIVTHGWQPLGDYTVDNLPQEAIVKKIGERLRGESDPINANIIAFEWEGAYTGPDLFQARTNADYSGALLGYALNDILEEDYTQDLHFIGHSYGTVVNGLSTRYLDHYGTLDSVGEIQFTTLDSPTFIGAPNLDSDWFKINLSNNIDYFDNYYGPFKSAVFGAFGESLEGANLNQMVDYNHSNVGSDFYPDLIERGDGADTNPWGLDLWPYNHKFNEWITPMLSSNWDDKPNENDFSNMGALPFIASVSENYTSVLGTPIIVDSIPTKDTYSFTGLYLEEQSPVSLFYDLDIPLWADWFAFDWMVENAGDGDWFTVHLDSELFLSMSISELIEGMIFQELFDISDYVGMKKKLYFTLNSVGDANASLYVGNLEYRGDNPVPEPTTMLLFGLGLLGLAGISRERNI